MAENTSHLEAMIRALDARVTALEKIINKESVKSNESNDAKSDFSGLRGGIRYLISQNFLNQPKAVKDVQEELIKEGYHYSIQSVDKTLRDLHQKNKILTRVNEANVWKYVVRK